MRYYSLERNNSFESDQSSSQAGLLHEKQSTSIPKARTWLTPRVLSDFTIGLSDGLTVPFALTAGLSALGNGKVVVSAGLAELVAGAISMGVAGYLGAKGERDAQLSSAQSTNAMITAEPEEALASLRSRFQEFAIPDELLDSIVNYYSTAHSAILLQTLLHLENPDTEVQPLRPWLTGLTIAVAYFFGGFVPLLPYIFSSVQTAFKISVVITATVLFTFGCVKVPLARAGSSAQKCLRSGLEMLVLGGLAAGAALGCVKALNHFRGGP